MKKNYLKKIRKVFLMIFSVLMISSNYLFAQEKVELTVAEGTSNNSYVPIYGTWMDVSQRSQTIYPANMLTSIVGDTIKGLIYYGSEADFTWQSTVTVSLGITTLDNLSAGWANEALTDVFTGQMYINTTNELYVLFSTPYVYNGGNLLIQFDSPEQNNNYGSCSFSGIEVSAASRNVYGSNYPAGEGTIRHFIPTTTFIYGAPPSCLKPQNIAVEAVSYDNVTIAWDDANNTNLWNIEYGPVGFTQGTGTMVQADSNPYTIIGLDPNTEYSVRVQAVCSGQDVSDWTKLINFKTLCGYVTLPYEQNFADSIFPPECWGRYKGLASEIFQGATLENTNIGWTSTNVNNGIEGRHMKVNIYGPNRNHWILSQLIQLDSDATLSFDIALTAYASSSAPTAVGDDDKFMVVIATDNGNTLLEANATIWDNTGTDYILSDIPETAQRVSIDLAQYTGQEVMLAFYVESTVGNSDIDLHIGNINIESGSTPPPPPPPPVYNPPVNLAGTVNGTDVTLTWEPPAKARDIILSEDLEGITNEVLPDGWIAIDADNDGHNWIPKNNDDSLGNNNSRGVFESWSYKVGVLTPDNYLITPMVDGATNISYYVYSSSMWGAEHYAIMASSTGNNPGDFTIVFEETLQNKSNNKSTKELEANSQTRQPWIDRSVDLPAGTKYVAIRHYDCSNQLVLRVDDIVITGGTPTPGDIVYNVYEDGTQVANELTATTFVKTDVPAGLHNYCVEAKYNDGGISDQVCVDITVDGPVPSCPAPTNLVGVADGTTANLTWTSPAKSDDRYVLVEEGFESGEIPANWINLDSDGDGRAWVTSTTELEAPIVPHEGNYAAASLSAYKEFGIWYALTPDNWLISPEILGANEITFWVHSQGSQFYDNETYGVFVSSTGTDVADFTSIYEENIHTSIGSTWTERTINLPPGTKYVAIRHFNSSDQYMMSVDDIVISSTIPNPGNYTFKVFRDNVEIGESNTTSYSDPNLTDGTYNYTVKTVCSGGELSNPSNVAVVVIGGVTPTCDPVTNLAGVANGNEVTLTWDAPAGTGVTSGIILTEDFEGITNGTLPVDWIAIDQDGDGNNWYGIHNNKFVPGYDSSLGLVASASWKLNNALTPDNYLITPMIDGAEVLKYFVRAQSQSASAEHYAIMASTTGTEVSDFTLVFEETITAKSLSTAVVDRERDYLGAWYERSVDLPAGTKYIAIRHYNCTDQYLINIDNISVESSGNSTVTYNIYQDGTQIASDVNALTYVYSGVANGNHNYCVEAVYDDGCVSLQVCVDVTVAGGGDCAPVTNLTGVANGNQVTLTWDAPTKGRDVILTEDFEETAVNEIPSGWISIDADGDGYEWGAYTTEYNPWITTHSGSVVMASRSWFTNPLTPDNYLITPNVEGATSVQYFYAVAEYFIAEHYAIMASSTGTDINDFTLVFEETVTGSKGANVDNNNASLRGRDPLPYVERNIDLPAGTKYVAFRHYNVTNLDYILLDDVTITGDNVPTPPIPTGDIVYNVYQDGVQIASGINETTYLQSGVTAGDYTYCVEAVYGDTCVSPQVCVDITVPGGGDCAPVTNLTGVANGDEVTLTWDAPAKGREVILTEDFEETAVNEIPAGWISIDADGDGNEWGAYTTEYHTWITTHSGSVVMASRSWIGGALTPDNYLITPNVEGATSIQYFYTVSEVYSAEHYAIMASSTGTNVSDFTLVYEETITGSKGLDAGINRNDASLKGRAPLPYIERNIDLPAGTKYVAIRHYNVTDIDYVLFDDVTVNGNGGPTPPTPTGDIVYNVYQNGVQIANNISETSYVQSGVSSGDYTYCVEAVYGDTCVSPQVCVDVSVVEIVCDPVTDLTALVDKDEVTLIWTAPAKSRDVILSEGFDNVETGQIPSGWVTIDADGDNHNWYCVVGDSYLPGYNNSLGIVKSDSWVSSMGKPALTPDNYLITPMVSGANKINYYVRTEATYYCAEHYAVMVSSSGTNPNDFSIIFEETMTASKEGLTPGRDTRANTPWRERSIDIPAGTKYIAFRHFDCTDQWALHIDNVEVEGGNVLPPGVIGYNVYENGVMIANNLIETSYFIQDLFNGDYTYCVEAVYGDTCISEQVCVDVVIDAPYCDPITNLVGTVDGNQVTLTWDSPIQAGEVIFEEDFEAASNFEIPSYWTNIDADGDGYKWYVTYNYQWTPGHNNSKGFAVSESWVVGKTDLTPDNYLITPLVEGARSVEYYVRIESDSWVNEHYAVMVSSTGTDPDDFTTVFEETMVAKGEVAGPKNSKKPGTWYYRGINLPEGTKYVAFRHYDVDGLYRLNLDDISVNNGLIDDLSYNVFQDGELIGTTSVPSFVVNDLPDGIYEFCVEGIYGDTCLSHLVCVTVTVGDGKCNPVSNLEGSVYNSEVSLSWDIPEDNPYYDLIGYSVYGDSRVLGTIADPYTTTITLNSADIEGINSYCVTALYEGCESESECIEATALGLEDNAEMSIYPNPADRIVNISGIDVDIVYVYNNAGQLVGQSRTNTVDVSSYSSGMYLFNIITVDGKSHKVKVIVKR